MRLLYQNDNGSFTDARAYHRLRKDTHESDYEVGYCRYWSSVFRFKKLLFQQSLWPSKFRLIVREGKFRENNG